MQPEEIVEAAAECETIGMEAAECETIGGSEQAIMEITDTSEQNYDCPRDFREFLVNNGASEWEVQQILQEFDTQ